MGMTTAHRSTLIPSQSNQSLNIFTDFFITKKINLKDKKISKRTSYNKIKYNFINLKKISPLQNLNMFDNSFTNKKFNEMRKILKFELLKVLKKKIKIS